MHGGIKKRLEALEGVNKPPADYEDLRGLLLDGFGVDDPELYRIESKGLVLYDLQRALEDETSNKGKGGDSHGG